MSKEKDAYKTSCSLIKEYLSVDLTSIENYVKYLEDKIERICSATGINPDTIK